MTPTRLAKIAMAEAEGEDTEGKAQVILVVLNRVWSNDFPDTIEGVITEKNQFTAYGKRQIRQSRTGCRLLPSTGNGAGRALG